MKSFRIYPPFPPYFHIFIFSYFLVSQPCQRAQGYGTKHDNAKAPGKPGTGSVLISEGKDRGKKKEGKRKSACNRLRYSNFKQFQALFQKVLQFVPVTCH